MFGDRDHATLHEIQNQFLLDEPGFVQGFDARPSRPTGSGPHRPPDHTDRAAPGSAGQLE